MSKVKEILTVIPNNPGVYQYFDGEGTLLYVGKAKNLKKRVSSYFTKTHDSARLNMLVRRIADIKYIIVNTEYDALLLENNLIKTNQPRYNINLKDDKTYPWLCIKNERFPRIFSTRRMIKDGSQYFGPYASVKTMRTLMELARQLFKTRSCNYALSQENIEKGKFRVCLEYHIGNCLGPCEGKQTEEEYASNIAALKDIIRGEIGQVTRMLKDQMTELAMDLKFEKANLLKEKLGILENYQAKSTVVSPTVGKVDVFSILNEEECAYINYMRVANGCIFQSHTLEVKKKLDESREELLEIAIVELRTRFESDTREILVPFEMSIDDADFTMAVPQRGDKRKLLELSEQNARAYLVDKLKHEKIVDPERHSKRILETMQKDLRLTEPPAHIECFDNSNIQGTNPVSACVVFKNAKPSKKDYRHFNIKTVEGPDDFASMEEVILRRYGRLQREGEALPQLIVIDGGKGQLGAALKSLELLGLRGQIAIIGIAKRLEELYYPGDPLPLYLDKKSETLKIIQQLRDEAHRFGLAHHRNRRSKGAIQSELDDIPGIGDNTRTKLYKHFKTLSAIRKASVEELAVVIQAARAKQVWEYFHRESEVPETD
ncbi:MAG: excinuclease ABC subunit UvrC [Bacteroidota bacterium]